MYESQGTTRLSVFIIIVSLIGAITLSVGSVALFERLNQASQRRTEQRIINRQVQAVLTRQTESLRSILCLAQGLVLQNRALTPQQLEQSLLFYTKALLAIKAEPCPSK